MEESFLLRRQLLPQSRPPQIIGQPVPAPPMTFLTTLPAPPLTFLTTHFMNYTVNSVSRLRMQSSLLAWQLGYLALYPFLGVPHMIPLTMRTPPTLHSAKACRFFSETTRP